MPRDALYEESAQPLNADKQARWYTTFHVLFVIFAIIAGIHAFTCLLVLPVSSKDYSGVSLALHLMLWLGALMALAMIAFLFWWIRRRFNISYDYLFVQDELRITKVFNGKRRKPLVTLAADHVLQLGYCEGATFERTYAGLSGAKPAVMTPNREPAEGKDFIHVLYSDSMGKRMYILECRKEMLEHLVLAVGRNKFVRE